MPTPAERVAAARRIAEAVAGRAALYEAVGVVRAWDGGNLGHARKMLDGQQTTKEREAEVARVTAIVEAAANGRADPDWRD